jgi:hypothetical protein
MPHLAAWGAFVVALLPRLATFAEDGKGYPRLAPYPAIRWSAEQPEVQLDGAWFRLDAIDGTTSREIVAFCKQRWPDIWQKRFEEDLVETLTRMGKPPKSSVALDLVDLATEKRSHLDKVEMTEANRRAIWNAAFERSRREGKGPAPVVLDRATAQADLDLLERLLADHYSYYARCSKEVSAGLAKAKSRVTDSQSIDDFACSVQEALACLGDGHSGVGSIEHHLAPGCARFLVGDAGGRLVAFREDRSAFLAADHPYLVKLDGLPIERWLEAAGRLVAHGSPSFVRYGSLRCLRFVNAQRRVLGLPLSDSMVATVADEQGATVDVPVDLTPSKPIFGEWPRTKSRLLPDPAGGGSTGYLRIASMDDDGLFLDDLHARMKEFADADGLVIDVRGNGGGSRRALLELFPYFMKADEPIHVANVARLRLGPGERRDRPEGFLGDRFLYPAASSTWSPDERAALEKLARTFRPEWDPPPEGMSEWHYLALRPALAKWRTRFDKPVVILLDGGCFSATDVFLGAFKGWRNVTLLGTPSGGGSGRAQEFTLPGSGLEIRLSSMASFRPDGSLYDGNGIAPDVVVPPRATDFLGTTDAQLDAALRRLRGTK